MFGMPWTKYNQCTESRQGWGVVGGIVRIRGNQSDTVSELASSCTFTSKCN